jgi:hypothetical protein
VERAVPWGIVSGKVARLFPVAIIGLFLTGAYMTHKFWTWGTSWIVVGIVGLVVLGVQGGVFAERTAKQLQAAMMANGPGPLGPEARRMTLHPGLWVVELSNFGLVLGIVGNDREARLGRHDRSCRDRLRGRRGARAAAAPLGAGGD